MMALLIYSAWPEHKTAWHAKPSILNPYSLPTADDNSYSPSATHDSTLNVMFPMMLGLATPVTNAGERAADGNVRGYFWLSNDTILFIRAGITTDLWRYDVTNRVETPLASHVSHLTELYYRPFVSPDGKWLLAQRPSGDVNAWQLDGSRVVAWKHTEGCAGWFNDSRHWFNFDAKHAFIHDVDAPAHTETIPLAPSSPLRLKDVTSSDNRDFGNLLCLSKSLLLARTDLRDIETLNGVPQIDIFVGSLDADVRHQQHYTVKAPIGFRICDAVFSPDGTRVAWLLRQTTTWSACLCVSRLNGSGMHVLETFVEPVGTTQFDDLAERYALRWRPDGKHLSFLYHEKLWTVSDET
jgi:hypothetical protein